MKPSYRYSSVCKSCYKKGITKCHHVDNVFSRGFRYVKGIIKAGFATLKSAGPRVKRLEYAEIAEEKGV